MLSLLQIPLQHPPPPPPAQSLPPYTLLHPSHLSPPLTFQRNNPIPTRKSVSETEKRRGRTEITADMKSTATRWLLVPSLSVIFRYQLHLGARKSHSSRHIVIANVNQFYLGQYFLYSASVSAVIMGILLAYRCVRLVWTDADNYDYVAIMRAGFNRYGIWREWWLRPYVAPPSTPSLNCSII